MAENFDIRDWASFRDSEAGSTLIANSDYAASVEKEYAKARRKAKTAKTSTSAAKRSSTSRAKKS